ncbi:MAG: protein-L-isoaspartate(D-aspartate) O-methyltransferase [Flavobacteriaceae bacterium]|nr:protein-L-isoaspartate(D-aspartate) O-methyltransferase [Flavobacteriaceae bacterium]
MKDSSKNQGLRKQLVELLGSKGIKDLNVLNAINNIPRQWFMESGLDTFAYEDKAYPIGEEQTISQPYTVAFQTELLNMKPGESVLEIGTGSGYQTCVLIELGFKVYSIERKRTLFKKAELLFRKLKWNPKKLVFGDGYLGLKNNAPYNGIIVTAAAPVVPNKLLEQLSIGGKLVIPIGKKEQIMTKYTRISKIEFNKETFGNFRFVPLLKDTN